MALVAGGLPRDLLGRTNEELRQTLEEEFEASQQQIVGEVQALLSTVLQELAAQFARLVQERQSLDLREFQLQESRRGLSEQLLVERSNFSAEADSLRKECHELREERDNHLVEIEALKRQNVEKEREKHLGEIEALKRQNVEKDRDMESLKLQHDVAIQALDLRQGEHARLLAEVKALRRGGGEDSTQQLSRIAELTQQNSDLAQRAAEAEVQAESKVEVVRWERDELKRSLAEMQEREWQVVPEAAQECGGSEVDAEEMRLPAGVDSLPTVPELPEESFMSLSDHEGSAQGDMLPATSELPEDFALLSEPDESTHGDKLPVISELPEDFTPLSEPEESTHGDKLPAMSELQQDFTPLSEPEGSTSGDKLPAMSELPEDFISLSEPEESTLEGVRSTSPESPPTPRGTSEEGSWFWQTRLPSGVGLGRLRYESLLLHREPSAESPITGCVFLEKFFKAKPSAQDQNWLEVSFSGTSGYLLRRDPSAESDERCDALLRRVDRPSKELAYGGAVQEFALGELGTAALLALIRREQDPSSDVDLDDPSGLARDEFFFWRVQSQNNFEVATYFEAKTEVASTTIRKGSIVLGRPDGPDWVRLSDAHGQSRYMRRRGPSGERLERVEDPLDILGLSSPLDLFSPLLVLGPGSCLRDPRPLENAVGRTGLGAGRVSAQNMLAVKAAALEALTSYLGQPVKEDVVVVQEFEGGGKQHRTFWVDMTATSQRFTLRCDQPVQRDLAVKQRLPPSINQARFIAAGKAIAAAGLGPEWCASGPGWHLEKQGGRALARLSTAAWTPEDLGGLLATLHRRVDTAWFDETLALFREFLPWARGLLRGSHAWWFACQPDAFVGLDENLLFDWARKPEFKPESEPARRIVTNSGDFILANVVLGLGGHFQVVGNERCNVTYAGQDLFRSYDYCFKAPKDRKRFLLAYLQGMGDLRRFKSTPAEEEELLQQVERDIGRFRLAFQSFQDISQRARSPAKAAPTPAGQGLAPGVTAAPPGAEAGAGAAAAPPARPVRLGTGPAKARKRKEASPRGRPLLQKPRARLQAHAASTGGRQGQPGRLGMWRARLAPGSLLEEGEVECLKLVRQMSRRREADGLVPLEQAVLAREVEEGKEWLEVLLDGSPHLYAHKGAMHSQSGIIWEKMAEQDLPDLMENPNLVFGISMTLKAFAATMVLFYGGLDKVPIGQRVRWQDQLQEGTRWWRATMDVVVRTQPRTSSSRPAYLKKGALVLGTPSADQQLAGESWVEVVPVSDGSVPRLYIGQELPGHGTLLEPVLSATKVLTSWHLVFDPPRKNLLMDAEDGRDLVMEEVKRIGSDYLSRVGRGQGTLAVVEMNGESRYHRTFQLQVRGPSRLESLAALRYDATVGMAGVPLIVFKERFAAARQLFYEPYRGSEKGLGPKQLYEGPRWHMEDWLGEAEAEPVHVLAVAKLMAKNHSLPTEWYEEYRDLFREFFPFLRSAPKGSHVWGAMTDKDIYGKLKRLTPQERETWATWKFECRSKASEKIVTVHGDYQRGNLKYSHGVLKSYDAEHCLVTWAVEDLAITLYNMPDSKQLRCDFIETYLREMGMTNFTSELVEDTVFDARCYRLAEKKLTRPPGKKVEDLEDVWNIARTEQTAHAQELREMIIASSLTAATDYHLKRKMQQFLLPAASRKPVTLGQAPPAAPPAAGARPPPARQLPSATLAWWQSTAAAVEEMDARSAAEEAAAVAATVAAPPSALPLQAAAVRPWQSAAAASAAASATLRALEVQRAAEEASSGSGSAASSSSTEVPAEEPLVRRLLGGGEQRLAPNWTAFLAALLTRQVHPELRDKWYRAVLEAVEIRRRSTPPSVFAGRLWLVVGASLDSKSIIVRRDAGLKSKRSGKLPVGAVVEELQRVDLRLKFRRLLGSKGPKDGWVSLTQGATNGGGRSEDLLMPLTP